ncbi:MAG TPA: STAS domain-containing protein [Planctomycetota bacterium]|nr:STAS domain-containing protein [Planctomycetota bacterium]
MEEFKIDAFDHSQGIGVIRISGSLDLSNIGALEATIEGFFRRGMVRLVIDLEKTSFIASSGFSSLLFSLDTAKELGGDIIFARATPAVREIFEILGLGMIAVFAHNVPSGVVQLRE